MENIASELFPNSPPTGQLRSAEQARRVDAAMETMRQPGAIAALQYELRHEQFNHLAALCAMAGRTVRDAEAHELVLAEIRVMLRRLGISSRKSNESSEQEG